MYNLRKHISELKWAAMMGATMALAPRASFAQQTLGGIITRVILPLLRNVVVAIFALALVYFVWEVMQYIGTQKPKEALAGMGWSLVAMFVMVSVWGLVTLLQNTFGVKGTTTPDLPQI